MSVLQKEFIKRLNEIAEGLSDEKLAETFNFERKIKIIEDADIAATKLLSDLAAKGHLSLETKTKMMRKFYVLLLELRKMKAEDYPKLMELKSEIEAFLITHLAAEQIGIEVNITLYHGSAMTGITRFVGNFMEQQGLDCCGCETLGEGLYTTNSKKMAINYAYHRYMDYKEHTTLAQYTFAPTVYSFRLKKNRNYFADLTDPIKLRAIYNQVHEFIQKIAKKPRESKSMTHHIEDLANAFGMIIEKNLFFKNIREMMLGIQEVSGKGFSEEDMMGYVVSYLKSIGFHGLRCPEAGEPRGFKLYEWEASMSYVIFYPEELEIVKEEQLSLEPVEKSLAGANK